MPLLPYPPSSPTDATTISITTPIAAAPLRFTTPQPSTPRCTITLKGAFGFVITAPKGLRWGLRQHNGLRVVFDNTTKGALV
ncbi:hypothetical protein Tco_0037158 [Tanacetum coccineum]